VNTTKHENRDESLAVFKIADFFLLPIAYRLSPVFIYVEAIFPGAGLRSGPVKAPKGNSFKLL
jgi:hypothetical protein